MVNQLGDKCLRVFLIVCWKVVERLLHKQDVGLGRFSERESSYLSTEVHSND